MKEYWVYILRCSDDKYYTGVTSNIEQRMAQHQEGAFPQCFTYKRRPVELVFAQPFDDVRQAILSEKKIQKWSRAKKEALIEENFDQLSKLASKKNFERQRCSPSASCWSCLDTASRSPQEQKTHMKNEMKKSHE